MDTHLRGLLEPIRAEDLLADAHDLAAKHEVLDDQRLRMDKE